MWALIQNRRCKEWPAGVKLGKEHCSGARQGGSFTDTLPAMAQNTRIVPWDPPAGTLRRAL